jgi:tRNA dimethylallyltransferase
MSSSIATLCVPSAKPFPWQVLAIVGATGTGKSLLADAFAAAHTGEVVSADSMQVYQGMNIGTAKLAQNERPVAYHCLDLVTLDVPFTAAEYQKAARLAIDGLHAQGKLPVVCGGTGLYVRAALDDFSFDAASSTHDAVTLRAELSAQADAMGSEAFHALLKARDAASAALIHPHNVRRVIRAFELLEEGSSYAEQHAGFSSYKPFYATCYIGIEVAPAVLYEVVNRRVEKLMADGLCDEVRKLVDAGYADTSGFRQAIGYKELRAVLEGTEDLAVATERIKQATRRYAKRQRSWFRRDARIHWLDATDLHEAVLHARLDASGFLAEIYARCLQKLPVA